MLRKLPTLGTVVYQYRDIEEMSILLYEDHCSPKQIAYSCLEFEVIGSQGEVFIYSKYSLR